MDKFPAFAVPLPDKTNVGQAEKRREIQWFYVCTLAFLLLTAFSV